VSDDRGEPLPNPRELVLALGERTSADAPHPQELQLVDALADLPEEPLDLSLSVHGVECPPRA
jgi:hypothetical protein